MSHALAFIGFGVIIPTKSVPEQVDLYEIAERYGLYVDWIEFAVGENDCGTDNPKEEGVYVIIYERTRKDIYDCSYGVIDWFEKKDCWQDIEQAKKYFFQLGGHLDMLLNPQWIIAQYRM
jgi:hypothetical protein